LYSCILQKAKKTENKVKLKTTPNKTHTRKKGQEMGNKHEETFI